MSLVARCKSYCIYQYNCKQYRIVAGKCKYSVARKLTDKAVNDVMGNALAWTPDSRSIVFTAIPSGRGTPPVRPMVASRPVVQESLGRRAAVRTFQDMLRDSHDEDLFDYYATSQLIKIDLSGNEQALGKPGVIWFFSISPNNQYVLLTTIQKPYSYIVPSAGSRKPLK
jgi:hypothetical protein